MLRLPRLAKRDTRYLVDNPGIPTLAEAINAFDKGGSASLPVHPAGSFDFQGDEPPTIEQMEELETQFDEDMLDAAAALYRDKVDAAALRRIEAAERARKEAEPIEPIQANPDDGGAQ